MGRIQGRIGALDILRAIAVLLVLGRHMPTPPADTLTPLRELFAVWIRCGWVGVDLFFVLSGFLVSGLLFREFDTYGNLHLGRFLVRRGLKIYPAFYCMLATTLLVSLLQGHRISIPRYLVELLFLQSYLPKIWNHTWTLAVEEHFYLLLAITFGFLAKNHGTSFRLIPAIFYWTALIVLALRLGVSVVFDYSHSTHLFPTHLRIDSLLFGVFLAYLFNFYPDQVRTFMQRFRFQAVAVSLILISPVLMVSLGSTPWLPTFGLTSIYLGFGGLLLAVVDYKPNCAATLRWFGDVLASIGVYSYSIYLWHMPVKNWSTGAIKLTTGVEIGFWVHLCIYLVGSIIAGVLLAKLIEFPILRFRDHYFPSRSRLPVTTPPSQID